jgi:hypothetical protein
MVSALGTDMVSVVAIEQDTFTIFLPDLQRVQTALGKDVGFEQFVLFATQWRDERLKVSIDGDGWRIWCGFRDQPCG